MTLPVSGELVAYSDSQPQVISTWSLQHAFGIWAPPSADSSRPPRYGSMHFVDGRTFADATQKWNVVWVHDPLPQGAAAETLGYKVFVCVGTQRAAADCLMKVIHGYDDILSY